MVVKSNMYWMKIIMKMQIMTKTIHSTDGHTWPRRQTSKHVCHSRSQTRLSSLIKSDPIYFYNSDFNKILFYDFMICSLAQTRLTFLFRWLFWIVCMKLKKTGSVISHRYKARHYQTVKGKVLWKRHNATAVPFKQSNI